MICENELLSNGCLGCGRHYRTMLEIFCLRDVLEILALDLMWLVNCRAGLRLGFVCLVVALAIALATTAG